MRHEYESRREEVIAELQSVAACLCFGAIFAIAVIIRILH